MYNYLKRMYALGKVSLETVRNSVVKGLITADEFESITGQKYE